MSTIKQTPILAEIQGKLGNSQWQKNTSGKNKPLTMRSSPGVNQNTRPRVTEKDLNFPRMPEKTLTEQWYWETTVLKQGNSKDRGKTNQIFNRQLMAFTDSYWHTLTEKEKSIWKREAKKQREVFSGFDLYRHVNMRRGMIDLMPLRTPPDPEKSKPTIVSRATGWQDMPPNKEWKMFLEGDTFDE